MKYKWYKTSMEKYRVAKLGPEDRLHTEARIYKNSNSKDWSKYSFMLLMDGFIVASGGAKTLETAKAFLFLLVTEHYTDKEVKHEIHQGIEDLSESW